MIIAEFIADIISPTDCASGSVVSVQLLDVGHGEVGLEGDRPGEVHDGLVGLVYQEVHLPPVVVDVRVVGVELHGPREVPEGELRVLARVLALLDEEGGVLDEGL